jgi:hypothetical protein
VSFRFPPRRNSNNQIDSYENLLPLKVNFGKELKIDKYQILRDEITSRIDLCASSTTKEGVDAYHLLAGILWQADAKMKLAGFGEVDYGTS